MTNRFLSLFLALAILLVSVGALAETADIEQTIYIMDNGTSNGKFTACPWASTTGTVYVCERWRALLTADAALNAKDGDLAENWTVSDDYLTYTFTIKDGLRWSDGEPLTAEDVKWSFDTAPVAAKTAGLLKTGLGFIEGFAALTAGETAELSGVTVDGNVVTIKLTDPYGAFLDVLAQFVILPKHCLKDAEMLTLDTNEFWNKPVSSGRFMVTDGVEGEYYIQELNPYYEGQPSKITKMVIKKTSDLNLSAQAGDIDLANSNSITEYEVISQLGTYSVRDTKNVIYYRMFWFNVVDNLKMQDLRVRNAVAYAVDWKTIIKSIYGETAGVTTSMVLSSSKFYAGDQYTYDPAYARQLLQEANYDFTKPFVIMYYYADQSTIDLLDAVAYSLGELGMTVELVYTSQAGTDLYVTKNYDLAFLGNTDISELGMYATYTDSVYHVVYDGTPWIDPYQKALRTSDEQEYAALLNELQALEAEYRYIIPAYTLQQQNYVKSDRLNIPEDLEWGANGFRWDTGFEAWEILGPYQH